MRIEGGGEVVEEEDGEGIEGEEMQGMIMPVKGGSQM
jgi:hypothetical protein